MIKQKTLSSFKKEAWSLFSKIVRLRDATDGTNRCVTCKQIYPIKNLQAGHFIPGRHNAVLFDLRQVWPQCYVCNFRKHGRWVEYREFMIKKYGEHEVEQIIAESKKTVKLSRTDYADMILKFSAILHGMEGKELWNG